MKIIIVAGMPGAGKEEFLSVASSMGISFARMGDVVREHYASSTGPCDGSNIGEFASAERKRFGKNIWAKRTIDRMCGDIFLVDGCRSMDEVGSFKEFSDNVLIVGIYSPPKIRYERLVIRDRADAPKNIDEFNARDSREISWGLAEVLALSDIMIVNTSNLSDFHSSSGKILRSLI